LGEIRFHLDAVESQDEYEVELDVIESVNKSTVAKIQCKIKFVWSFYTMYQDLVNKSEKKINKFSNNIQKSNKIIDVLNGILIANIRPFQFLSRWKQEHGIQRFRPWKYH
jgi:hypothetical protein